MPEFDAHYFEQNYGDYEAQNPERKLKHYHRIISTRAGSGHRRALDVGCGLGLWAGYLAAAEPGWTVSAVDVDPDVITANAVRFPAVEFSARRAGEGLPSERYDVITALDVLEHVPDIERQYPAVCSWLNPDGLMAFVVPVYDGPLGWLVHLLDRDPTHIHKWGRDRWLDLAGRHLVDVEWHGVFRLLLPGGYYIHLPTRRLRSIAPAIMVTGRLR